MATSAAALAQPLSDRQGVSDEKVLAVPETSPTHASVRHHTDLEPHVLKEIEHFFTVYKQLEGKHTEVRGWRDVGYAHELIRLSHKRFQPA